LIFCAARRSFPKGVDGYAAAKDPGVLAVRDIYNYYKCHGWKTSASPALRRVCPSLISPGANCLACADF
jgi:transaldolase